MNEQRGINDTDQERRAEQRLSSTEPISFSYLIEGDDLELTYKGIVIDYSSEGLGFYSFRKLEKSERLRLKLTEQLRGRLCERYPEHFETYCLSEFPELEHLGAEVKWCLHLDEDLYRVGLYFD